MVTNFDRFLAIISKWPVVSMRKQMDYGYHLRQLIKNKNIDGNVFPGTSAENVEKLDSLTRIVSNYYGVKNECSATFGATGVDLKTMEALLDKDFLDYCDKKRHTAMEIIIIKNNKQKLQ